MKIKTVVPVRIPGITIPARFDRQTVPGITILAVIFLTLLSACNNPAVIPADLAVTLPPNQDFILRATVPPTPIPGSETPTPQDTVTPSPTLTPAATSTPKPKPASTRKSVYPAAPGTPVIDLGFPAISVDQVKSLKPVFSIETSPTRRHSAISLDGQKLFVSSSDGTFLFNRKGEILAHWPEILTTDIACDSCISANLDGSQLAVITRSAGKWEAQVYDVQGSEATLSLELPVEPSFQNITNEASIAISPDGSFLAIHAGPGSLRVLDLKSKLQVLDSTRPVNGISFTPDGANFVLHTGGQLLFYNVKTWNSPASLLLPLEDTPYTFSPDGHMVAIAMATMLRVYTLEGIKVFSEISVPPATATNRDWQITFTDNHTLAGYAIRWDTYHTSAIVESGQWDISARKTLHFDTTNSNTPDALAALWGSPLSLPVTTNILTADSLAFNGFHFLSNGILLVNSTHTACWLKLFTADNACYSDPNHRLFTSDANIFKELVVNNNTSLADFHSGKTVIDVGPYPVLNLNRSGDFALVNTGQGTDLYRKGVKLPQESMKGVLQGYAENGKSFVVSTAESATGFRITIVDKTSGNGTFQVQLNFLYKPILMAANGTIYFMQYNLTDNQTSFFTLDPKTHDTTQIAKLTIPAEPRTLAISTTGLFAVGQKDGAVMILSQNGDQSASFQAAATEIENLDFSPDGRLLAVASSDGVRVFAVLPASK